ncbi:MAG: hypothetical protein KBD53_09545 [Candidatus Omnitrophica bacterium]|nr:hypothetical protein [Candidatus Omnitrophota bacterium]
MNRLFSTFFIFCILMINLPAQAEQEKLIQLKDGSSLTGQVLGLVDKVYTIRTADLGMIKIEEEKILSISNKNIETNQIPATEPALIPVAVPTINTTPTTPNLTSSNMNAQMQTIQQDIMSNPVLMADIQAMASDPEIVKLLTDPAFMQSMMSMDMAAIQNDPKFKVLLENEKMRSLIEKIKNQK